MNANIRNGIWSIAEVAIYPMVMIVATPFFLSKLGPDVYGIWMLVNTIVASLGVVNIGGADAVVRFIAFHRGEGKKEKIQNVVNISFALNLAIGVFLCFLGFVLPELLLESSFFSVDSESERLFANTLSWGVWLTALKFMEQLFVSIPKGYERYDISSRMMIASKLGLLSIQMYLVYQGFALNDVFMGATIFMAIVLVIQSVLVSNVFIEVKYRLPKSLKENSGLLIFGLWTWVYALISILSSQMDRLIISSRLNMVTLGYYSVAAMVAMQLHSVFGAGVGWLFPRVAQGRGKNENLRPLYLKLQYGLMTSVAFIVLSLYWFRDWLFSLWLGENWVNIAPFMELFLLLIFVESITIIPYYFFRSEAIKLSTIFKLLLSISTMVTMVGGFILFGVMGLLWAKIIVPSIFGCLSRYVLEKRTFVNENSWHSFLIIIPVGFFSVFAYSLDWLSILNKTIVLMIILGVLLLTQSIIHRRLETIE